MSNFKQLKVGDNTFTLTKWKTSTQWRNFVPIARVFGVPYFQLASANGDEDKGAELIPIAFSLLLDQMEDNPELLELCLHGVATKTKQQVDEDDFEDMDDLIYVVSENLKLNYEKVMQGKGFTAFLPIAQKMAQQTQK